MYGFRIRDLLCLFCCPPCPGSITAKLAFQPPSPSYDLLRDSEGKLTLLPRKDAEWQLPHQDLARTEAFFARSSRGSDVLCLFVRCDPGARFTVLFSHGNAVDVGHMCAFYVVLGRQINCNVFSYDYSGYGRSTGRPREENLYADIEAAWRALQANCGVRPEDVILYGQSIGTVPTVDLAAKHGAAAVVLHSPLMSAVRVAFPDTERTWCCDAFPSIEKISEVTAPTLVIHGTEDEVISIAHGLKIFERCPRAVEPLWVSGAGHDDIETRNEYLERLRQFVNEEIGSC